MLINGTTYKDDTTLDVARILEQSRLNKMRIRLHYGDTKTGMDWLDIYEVDGYVGRSTGSSKIPILLCNSKSIGGGGIFDDCIVKITCRKGKKRVVLYQHPKYSLPKLSILHNPKSKNSPYVVVYDKRNVEWFGCMTEVEAKRIIKRLTDD